MNETIIGLWGTADVGKSTTLSSLGRLLDSADASTDADISLAEYRAVFDYRGIKVGVQTFGDNERVVREGLEHFLLHNCKIIVIASKTYGATADQINRVARLNAYRVIWAAPYQVIDGTIATEVVKNYGAGHLHQMIDDIISGAL